MRAKQIIGGFDTFHGIGVDRKLHNANIKTRVSLLLNQSGNYLWVPYLVRILKLVDIDNMKLYPFNQSP